MSRVDPPDGAPLVSVVTIFRDADKFLSEAVESVFAQSYAHWELLLVDDGSTDRSTEIARRCAATHPDRVRYLEHEGHANRGMSASRNLGIARAQGTFIALLDADDVWFPRRLEEQAAVFAMHPEIALVYGNRQYWTSWDPSDPREDSLSVHGVTPDRVVHAPELFLKTYCEQSTTNPGSDVTFRRDLALRVGGFEESFRGMYEDQAFLVKVYLEAPVFVSRLCWLRYRQHSASCVARATNGGDAESSWHSFLQWMDGYARRRAIGDRRVSNALREALRRGSSWRGRVRRYGRAVRRPLTLGARSGGAV